MGSFVLEGLSRILEIARVKTALIHAFIPHGDAIYSPKQQTSGRAMLHIVFSHLNDFAFNFDKM